MGQANALAVLAVGDKGCFLNAPDMYMEKLIVGPGAKGAIDLNLPLADNSTCCTGLAAHQKAWYPQR